MEAESLKQILERIRARRSAALPANASQHDASTEQSAVQDTCSPCGGRGWYTPDVVVGHPDFGRVITCHCQEQRLSEERLSRLLRYSNLGSLTRFTFDTLNPQSVVEDAESRAMFAVRRTAMS